MDPCLPVDPPSLCGRLPAPCPVVRVAYVTVALKCLRAGTRPTGSGASYTIASRWTPPGVLLWPNGACGVASWYRHVFVHGAIRATSLPLLVSDVAHDKSSWPFWLPRTDPKYAFLVENDGVPQLVGGYWPAQLRQLARRLPLPFHGSGRANNCRRWTSKRTCYLVDPASSHMLVSKIKPCMCKYEPI